MGVTMNILNQVSAKIAALDSGEQWILTPQNLWMSRADFQSLSVYLSQYANQGNYSINCAKQSSAWLGHTSLTVIKH